MKFLIISQRTIPNPNFSLKNLTGHGRFDIICRAILAASRSLFDHSMEEIICFLKGAEPQQQGWLIWQKNTDDMNEITLAHELKINWDRYFTLGSLKDLGHLLKEFEFWQLSESGLNYHQILTTKSNLDDKIIVLGAQQDLTEEDLTIINPQKILKLGEQALLASHAVTLFRQLAWETMF